MSSEHMTSRERLTAVLERRIPDHVPVMPDISCMVPTRLTGKPFWDVFLYNDPPRWSAYLDAVKYFGIDSLMDCFDVQFVFEGLDTNTNLYDQTAIVFKNDDRIVTQDYYEAGGKQHWAGYVHIYHRDNPPNMYFDPYKVKLPKVPDKFQKLEGVRKHPEGEELLKLIKTKLGDHGLIGVYCGTSMLVGTEQDILDFYDEPERYYKRRDELLEYYTKKFMKIMSLSCRPDFIATGGSGTLIFQTVETFRELGLPIVKKMTALAKEHGLPSHIHSCGPEKALVKICAEETDLTVIDPLEIPPMGDCDLKELKRLFGHKLVLKGNLHTTNVMLRGSVQDVRDACKRAIDDAAEGGGFILSTGDQCGRDTPDDNIFAMVETAKTYGRY